MIGRVYAQCEAAEPFYAGSVPLPQIGIVAPGDPTLDPDTTDLSLEGAVMMCDEAHYDSVVLDDQSDFRGFELVILPDSVVLTEALQARLAAYVVSGGKVVFSGTSAFSSTGASGLPGIPLTQVGMTSLFPTYWRAEPEFHLSLSLSDRVVYRPGCEVTAGPGAQVLVHRVLPYFARTDLSFSSHFQTPPRAEADGHPAVVGGSNYVYFADPIFREYRESGNIAVRDGWLAAMERLVGKAPFGAGLPTTVLCTPRRRGDDLLLTLLHYIPTRKALTVDMIEERSSFTGETLNLPASVQEVRRYAGQSLKKSATGTFELPAEKGRLLLEVPGYFG